MKKNSPKHKFMARINYAQPLSEIGSESIARGNTLQECEHNALFYTEQARRNNVSANVVILENAKQYPYFEWNEVKRYNA